MFKKKQLRLNIQFKLDRQKFISEYEAKNHKPELIEKQISNPDKHDFFLHDKTRWTYTDGKGRNQGISHLKSNVGNSLNKALISIEDANPNTLQDVQKGINFNHRIGQRTLDDSTLIQFIQNF